jgi:hypothetical protein
MLYNANIGILENMSEISKSHHTMEKNHIYLFTRCKDTEMNKDVWLNSSVSGVRVMVFNDTFNSTNVFQLYRGGKFYWWKNPEQR